MNILKRIRNNNVTVGLDIGSYSLKLAKVRHLKEENRLEAVGMKELKVGIVENGEVKDRDGLIDAVTDLINQCDPSIVDVVISMSGQGILTDKFNFKIDPTENSEEMILWEAGQRSPFDVDDITLDYKILREIPEKDEIEVLLVAAKNHVMQVYIDLLYEAGLRPLIVDVDAFAISNCFALENLSDSVEGTVALINIGHAMTNVTFLKNGIYHSSRDIATAGDFFIKTLKRNLDKSYDEVMDIIKGTVDFSKQKDMVEHSLEYSFDELLSGIDLAFSYFKSSEKSDKLDKIVLSGGGAYIQGMVSALKNHFITAEVSISNPFGVLTYEPELFGMVDSKKISAFMSVAVGLALRKVSV